MGFRKSPGSTDVNVNVVGQSALARYSKISSERTYNMFISENGNPRDSENYQAWLVSFPGYQRFLDIEPPGSGRGLYNCIRGDIAILVINATVYQLNPDFTYSTIGTLATTSGEVFIAENLNGMICIVDGLNAYVYNYQTSSALVIQKNGALGSGALIPNYVEYHNTFFLFGNANTTAAGAFWYAYSPGLDSALGNMTVLGTGVLAATELLINGIDVAGTYTTVAAFVNFINSGVILGVTATNSGAAVTLHSLNTITLSTAGTVGMNGITFANFSTTGGALSTTFGTASPTTIAQTSQLALQTKADFAIAVKRIPGQANNVIVFGHVVAEIWTNIGRLLNYERNPTKNINYGCLSVSTIGEGGDILAWLATNQDESPIIMAYLGNEIKKISTDGIDYELKRLVAPQVSTALLYHADGHLFYQLTFFDPRDNLTILYDFNTDMFFHLTDQNSNYHPARDVMYFNLETYFLSLNSGSLYELSSEITVINENLPTNQSPDATLIYNIPRKRITANIRQANSSRFRVNSFVITLEQGCDENYSQLSAQAAQGSLLVTEDTFVPPDDYIITEQGELIGTDDSSFLNFAVSNLYYYPKILLRFSKDGGITWSNIVERQLHPIGDRQNILEWENMGVANDITWMIEFWGSFRFVVNNAVIQLVAA